MFNLLKCSNCYCNNDYLSLFFQTKLLMITISLFVKKKQKAMNYTHIYTVMHICYAEIPEFNKFIIYILSVIYWFAVDGKFVNILLYIF